MVIHVGQEETEIPGPATVSKRASQAQAQNAQGSYSVAQRAARLCSFPEYGRRTSPRKESQDSHQAVGMNLFQIMGNRSAVCWRRQSCNCKELDWANGLACEWEFAGVKDGRKSCE